MDVLSLIKEVAFPIFAAAYLLVEQTRKLDKMNLAIMKMNLYIMIMLAKQNINVGDPALVAMINQYLETTKEKKK